MKTKKAIGTKFFNQGTQNQKILQKYWGTGKSFTTTDLRKSLKIASPGARLTEIKDAGFDVRVVETETLKTVGRPQAKYRIMQRRIFA